VGDGAIVHLDRYIHHQYALGPFEGFQPSG